MAAPVAPQHDPYFTDDGKDVRKGRKQSSKATPQEDAWSKALRRAGMGLGVMLNLLAIVMTIWNLLVISGFAKRP